MGVDDRQDAANVLSAVSAIVAEVVERPSHTIDPERRVAEQGVDSLGLVEVFVRVHSEFNLPPPADDSVFAVYDTPAKIARYVLGAQP